MNSTLCQTIGPRIFPQGFSHFYFLPLFTFSSILFSHILDVAARVSRSPDSYYGQTIVSQVMQTANTTNKYRVGAHQAPINNLGIDYHQYCSFSLRATLAVSVVALPASWRAMAASTDCATTARWGVRLQEGRNDRIL
jgi:hypothetical protein